MDELSVTGPTDAVEIASGEVAARLRIHPEDCGLARHPLAALAGGDARTNAAITRDVLEGKSGGPRDAVLLNAAAALYIAGLASRLAEGVEIARSSVDSGRALAVLEHMIVVTNRLGTAGVPDRMQKVGPT
jgi:anthranilate phosphoribosyltransferase